MVAAFAAVLVVHGLLHLLGAAKGLRFAALPQLTQPISPSLGLLWLAAASLFVSSAVCVFVWPRGWWIVATVALVASTAALIPSWNDAQFGALVNVVVLVGAGFGFLAHGPFSLRAAYDDDVSAGLVPVSHHQIVTEADLASLPPPVTKYLRLVGVVGRPRVDNFRVTMRGRIRSGPDAGWMPFRAEQHTVVHERTRLFYLDASLLGIPVQGYHRYASGRASMEVKAAALVRVASAAGAQMTQSETVTLLNDMCIFAPATLIDPHISWQSVDRLTARATFTHAGYTVSADLTFADSGELLDFVSDDRSRLSPDGTHLTRARWSTPVSQYQDRAGLHLPTFGVGRWQDASGEYDYLQLTIDEVRYNVNESRRPRTRI